MEELESVAYLRVLDQEKDRVLLVVGEGPGCSFKFPYTEDRRQQYNCRVQGSLVELEKIVAKLLSIPLLSGLSAELRTKLSLPDSAVGLIVGKDGAGLVKIRRTPGILDVRGLYRIPQNPDRRLLVIWSLIQVSCRKFCCCPRYYCVGRKYACS